MSSEEVERAEKCVISWAVSWRHRKNETTEDGLFNAVCVLESEIKKRLASFQAMTGREGPSVSIPSGVHPSNLTTVIEVGEDRVREIVDRQIALRACDDHEALGDLQVFTRTSIAALESHHNADDALWNAHEKRIKALEASANPQQLVEHEHAIGALAGKVEALESGALGRNDAQWWAAIGSAETRLSGLEAEIKRMLSRCDPPIEPLLPKKHLVLDPVDLSKPPAPAPESGKRIEARDSCEHGVERGWSCGLCGTAGKIPAAPSAAGDRVTAEDEFEEHSLGLWSKPFMPSEHVHAVNRADFLEIVKRRDAEARAAALEEVKTAVVRALYSRNFKDLADVQSYVKAALAFLRAEAGSERKAGE